VTSWHLRPAIELPLPRLAEIFAASFEAYLVPVSANVDAFATRLRSEHVDLAASLVAFDGEAPAGLALIARRGSTARVAAMGVVTAARKSGLGRTLLDATLEQARARGERRVLLEVIEQNLPARALYERSGFVTTRRLVGFRAPPLANESEAPPPPTALEERPLEDLVRAYLAEADPDLPWQLAPATIAAAASPALAFALDSALALVEVLPAAVVVRALVVPRNRRRAGRATQLVQALRARFPDRALRVVPIVPEGLVGAMPARVGAVLDELAQLELAREL
jgi:GNAT superfamily N-acetyltransferase